MSAPRRPAEWLARSLGALLAVWPLRAAGTFSGFLPAVYLAVATEWAQTLLAARTLDVTDLKIQTAGATVGGSSCAGAGYRPYGGQGTSR